MISQLMCNATVQLPDLGTVDCVGVHGHSAQLHLFPVSVNRMLEAAYAIATAE